MRGKTSANPRIKEALRQKRAASSNLRRIIRECQEVCPHDAVVEAPSKGGEFFGPMPAIRVCIKCGLEEYSKWGTELGGKWGPLTTGRCNYDSDYSRKPALTTEFFKKVSRDDIRKYQIKE